MEIKAHLFSPICNGWLVVTQKPKRTVFQYCKSMLTVSKCLENCQKVLSAHV